MLRSSTEGATERAGALPAIDAVAMAVDGGEMLTYAGWQARSNAVARGLRARGVGAGDRVGLLFTGRGWVDFAVAHAAVVKAGGVAVLLSPGASPVDVGRALAHSGVRGLLCPTDLGVAAGAAGSSAWVAEPGELAVGHGTGPLGPRVLDGTALAEVAYPPSPLTPFRPVVRTYDEVTAWVAGTPAGPFVHAWAPGSLAGRYATGLLRTGGQCAVVALPTFDPDRYVAVVAGWGAAGCGLTPALAAALLASGAADRHDLSSVTEILVSGPARPGVAAGLRAAFGSAAVRLLDDAGPPAAHLDRLAPAAVSQEPMLWHEQFAPASFNLPCLVRRYRGALDAVALDDALTELVQRHEPLRSTFMLVDGQPRQAVRELVAPTLATTDLSGLSPDDRDAAAAAVIADASRRPFDLAAGPLFEPRLVRLGPEDHLLVVRLHHTVFDDWSVDLFRRELSALYAAARRGAPSPLMGPAITFGHHARRQRARLAGAEGASERAWWRRELAGAPLAVQLPVGGPVEDSDGVGGASAEGEPLRIELPGALVDALRAAAPQLRATPFMTVLAAFSLLVSRLTGQDDLVIATVVAHRNTTDVEPLVGCFTKKVPVRLRLQGDPTFAELVARTRSSLIGALSHQDLAFDDAVGEGLGRDAADHGAVPHVAVVFQGETPQKVPLALPGLTIGPYPVAASARRERHFSSGPDSTDAGRPVWGDGMYLDTFLILSLLETTEGVALVARGVFARAPAQRLLDDLQALLAAAVASPLHRVSELVAGPRPRARPDDEVDVRGLRASRSRIEAALSSAPGVAEVTVAVRDDGADGPCLVASVVSAAGPPPSLAGLRRALWTARPGVLWPAAVEVDGRIAEGRGDTDPTAALLAAMWTEIAGRPVDAGTSYWQDFSFLQLLAEAREAGLGVEDRHVVRCRTLAALTEAMVADARRPTG
ncbi:MAG TPA: condensation domain-containing protein [Acidimicrobiales bacterium]|nr:condensation domain-containing protein [Acidimicrobiales bacterium]